jgi:hypothetical protein
MYICIKFLMSSFNDFLDIAIQPKDKYRFPMAAMLLFYITQKQILNKSFTLRFSKTYYNTQFQNPTLVR